MDPEAESIRLLCFRSLDSITAGSQRLALAAQLHRRLLVRRVAGPQARLAIADPEAERLRLHRAEKSLVGDEHSARRRNHQLDLALLPAAHVVQLVELHQLQSGNRDRGVQMLHVDLDNDVRLRPLVRDGHAELDVAAHVDGARRRDQRVEAGVAVGQAAAEAVQRRGARLEVLVGPAGSSIVILFGLAGWIATNRESITILRLPHVVRSEVGQLRIGFHPRVREPARRVVPAPQNRE